VTALAAKPDRHPNWSDLRSQHPGVQTLVWLFALPVAVWLWAVHLPHERRAPALTFAAMVTVFCLAVPVAAGVGERTAADAAADLADASASTMQPLTPESAPTTAARTTAAPTTAAPTTVAPTTAAPTTAALTTAAPPTTAAAPTAVVPPADVAALIGQLPVGAETDHDTYSRDLFAGWSDADDNGCDTRCEVLAAERHDSLPGLPDGGWLSPYDGYSTPDESELDIDHLVPLAEAWRSGASRWDPARRAAFANDLDAPESLIAVTAATNRSKSDSDPAGWQPPNTAHWCNYVSDWVTVKLRWGLTADPAEVTALTNMAARC
jgi:hypothetical protein